MLLIIVHDVTTRFIGPIAHILLLMLGTVVTSGAGQLLRRRGAMGVLITLYGRVSEQTAGAGL